jgi:hypothetical protein
MDMSLKLLLINIQINQGRMMKDKKKQQSESVKMAKYWVLI